MRASCLPVVLGIAVACSGEPFTVPASSDSNPAATSAGSGGSPAAPATTTDDAKAGAGTAGAGAEQPRGGTNATAGEPVPQAGGVSGALGGALAGAGGEASAAPGCPSEAESDWELGYFPELREATAQESHPFFQVTNRGATTALNRIVMRYYFTKESNVSETAVCYWVTGDRCSLAKIEFRDMSAPTASASRYLEVSFPGASDVTVGAESLEVRVGFKTGSAALLQTNDYSFDPNAVAPSSTTPFPYKRWLQTTLYLDGELVWGTEPCASSSNASAP